MISFELSLLVLLIAVILLLIFYVIYLTEPSAKPSAQEKLSFEEKISTKKTATATNPKEEGKRQSPPRHQADSAKCSHGFGNLKKRDKDTAIPDECLSCPRMLECLGSDR